MSNKNSFFLLLKMCRDYKINLAQSKKYIVAKETGAHVEAMKTSTH